MIWVSKAYQWDDSFITCLFIKFAECSLETKWLISFVVILYWRDHLHLSSSMQSPFIPCWHDIVSSSLYSLAVASNKPRWVHQATSEGMWWATCDRKIYSHNGIRSSEEDSERFIHSAVCSGEAVRSRRKMRWARVVVPPWSYLRSGDRTPNRYVAQWRWLLLT